VKARGPEGVCGAFSILQVGEKKNIVAFPLIQPRAFLGSAAAEAA